VKKPQLILVDDHQIFRKGLSSILSIENIATVLAEASNGVELLELLHVHKPDIILMDIDMPEMDGFETTQKVLEILPDVKIIAFTMFEDQEYFQRMIELGAKGFILKSTDIAELEKVIYKVMNGEKFFSISHIEKETGKKKPQLIKDNNENGNREKQSKGLVGTDIPWF
jgi:DNA-binding NarL/FixJ family response regulator